MTVRTIKALIIALILATPALVCGASALARKAAS